MARIPYRTDVGISLRTLKFQEEQSLVTITKCQDSRQNSRGHESLEVQIVGTSSPLFSSFLLLRSLFLGSPSHQCNAMQCIPFPPSFLLLMLYPNMQINILFYYASSSCICSPSCSASNMPALLFPWLGNTQWFMALRSFCNAAVCLGFGFSLILNLRPFRSQWSWVARVLFVQVEFVLTLIGNSMRVIAASEWVSELVREWVSEWVSERGKPVLWIVVRISLAMASEPVTKAGGASSGGNTEIPRIR